VKKEEHTNSAPLPPLPEQPGRSPSASRSPRKVKPTAADSPEPTLGNVFGVVGAGSVPIAASLLKRYESWNSSLAVTGITLTSATGEMIVIRPVQGGVVVGYKDHRGVTKWGTMHAADDTLPFMPTVSGI